MIVNIFSCPLFFFFNDTATTEIYTLSLHDALPINWESHLIAAHVDGADGSLGREAMRSEEHTSALQSREKLVCRLLLEKNKKILNSMVILLTQTHRDSCATTIRL